MFTLLIFLFQFPFSSNRKSNVKHRNYVLLLQAAMRQVYYNTFYILLFKNSLVPCRAKKETENQSKEKLPSLKIGSSLWVLVLGNPATMAMLLGKVVMKIMTRSLSSGGILGSPGSPESSISYHSQMILLASRVHSRFGQWRCIVSGILSFSTSFSPE